MRIPDVRPQAFTAQLRCDRCGVLAQHNVDIGFNNFLQIGFDAGYGSDIGDGTRVDLDLCHRCLTETLGPWLRLARTHGNQPSAADPVAAGEPKPVPAAEDGAPRLDL